MQREKGFGKNAYKLSPVGFLNSSSKQKYYHLKSSNTDDTSINSFFLYKWKIDREEEIKKKNWSKKDCKKISSLHFVTTPYIFVLCSAGCWWGNLRWTPTSHQSMTKRLVSHQELLVSMSFETITKFRLKKFFRWIL